MESRSVSGQTLAEQQADADERGAHQGEAAGLRRVVYDFHNPEPLSGREIIRGPEGVLRRIRSGPGTAGDRINCVRDPGLRSGIRDEGCGLSLIHI